MKNPDISTRHLFIKVKTVKIGSSNNYLSAKVGI